eukprot:GDKI01037628.1.p1 GENE.GDKI01037628.1~~GDKI01037628.1.p1  ORF type:complete len:471 (+),score=154.94 GDKI01037628.1:146-1558(+)
MSFSEKAAVRLKQALSGNYTNTGWNRVNSIEKFAKRPVRSITMQQLMKTTSSAPSALVRNAEWIREEMAVRMAHRLFDFNRQPHVMLINPSVKKVYELYLATFDCMMEHPAVHSEVEEREFTKLLQAVVETHGGVVDIMRKGVKELRTSSPDISQHMDFFLERLFVTRISRRVMLEHHLALHSPRPNYAGVVSLQCKPADVVKEVAEQVGAICEQTFGLSPEVTVTDSSMSKRGVTGRMDGDPTVFPFIPEHLKVIMYEVLKNSMRATVEFHSVPNSLGVMPEVSSELPPISVKVFKGKENVTIKVADKGGGIPPHKFHKIWSYGYTTVGEDDDGVSVNGNNDAIGLQSMHQRDANELAGYGFGLPLSRAYARYFGGDIFLQSIPGLGTDAYITLNHVGDRREALVDFDMPGVYANAFAQAQANAPIPGVQSTTMYGYTYNPGGMMGGGIGVNPAIAAAAAMSGGVQSAP